MKQMESRLVRFVQQAMVQVLALKDDALDSTTTHTREFSFRIFQGSSPVSPQQGFNQTNKARLVNSHRLFDTDTTCKCMRFCNIVQASCVTPETSHECFPQIDSVRHSSSIRSVSAVPGLHQHSPASHVHPRSVLQRSPLVPLRNPGFQEPVATARVNEFWAVDVAGRCFSNHGKFVSCEIPFYEKGLSKSLPSTRAVPSSAATPQDHRFPKFCKNVEHGSQQAPLPCVSL